MQSWFFQRLFTTSCFPSHLYNKSSFSFTSTSTSIFSSLRYPPTTLKTKLLKSPLYSKFRTSLILKRHEKKPKSKVWIPITFMFFFSCASYVTFYASEQTQQKIKGVLRSCHTFINVSDIMLKYKYIFWKYGELGITSETYIKERSKVHQQSANILLELCRSHGGIYIKAAQHLASLIKIVPKEYTDTLSVLQDKAPFRPFEEIAKVIHKELGSYPSELFLEFDHTPLAAASLAQVHRAVTLQGEECAIKVQYPEVIDNFYVDVHCMRTLCGLVTFFFPEFNLAWIVQEFESNILKEFDFLQEGHQTEATSKRFEHFKSRFHVPRIFWNLSTPKILTMEYIRGTKITCFEELKKQGFRTEKLASTLIDVFSEMIFIHGIVHCDPHPGNLLVRYDPTHPTKEQLVLLDHGLYRTLDPQFRESYAQLWVAILSNSSELLKEVSVPLGLQEYVDLLPTLFAGWVPGGSSKMYLGDDITEQHRQLLKQRLVHFDWLDAMSFLSNMQRDMLFVMRTFALVGAVHRALGGTNANKFRTIALVSLKGWYFNQSAWLRWEWMYYGVRIFWNLWALRCWRAIQQWIHSVSD